MTFVSAAGVRSKVPASEQNGWWVAPRPLPAGATAYVAPGDVCDAWGDYNGTGAGQVSARDPGLTCVPARTQTLLRRARRR